MFCLACFGKKTRETKEFCPPEETTRSVPSFPCMSPRSLPDIPENKTPEEEFSLAVETAPQRAPETLAGRRRSSGGIQRQASVCLSDEEDETSFYSPHELESVKIEGRSVIPSTEYTACTPPRSAPHTPPAIGAAISELSSYQRQPSTTQIHAAVVHRSGDLNSTAAGKSPDRTSQCSCCRNSRGSQGSHSHNSSIDSSSARTVIAVLEYTGTASSVSNGFSNGEAEDGRWLKSCAEEDETRAAKLTVIRTPLGKGGSCRSIEEYGFEETKPSRVADSMSRAAKRSTGSCPSLRLTRDMHSSSSLETSGDGWTEIPTPLREATSTELGLLERGLEHHREETKRRLMTLQRPESGVGLEGNSGDDDSESKRPVRYNDTGSREEIREEDSSVLSPSPPTTSESEAQEEEVEEYMEEGLDYDSLRAAYRQLWELRATFEEEEDLSDTLRLDEEDEKEEEDEEEVVEGHREEMKEEEEEEERKSNAEGCSDAPRLSPDREPSSQATSFESNTEPCTEEGEGCNIKSEGSSGETKKDEPEIKIYSNLLSLPTPESRRSSFTSRLGKRLKRSSPKGPSSESQDVSATSFDSVETEWSSTEASRAGEDPSTSFESTTTTDYNTDSSATESLQSRRLQQMKADSGYKSMESNGRRHPKLSRGKPMRSTVDGESIDELDETKIVCEPITCTSSAVLLIGPNVTPAMIEKSKSMSALKKRLQPWKDWPSTLQITASKSMSTCSISSPSTAITTVLTTTGVAAIPTALDEVISLAPTVLKCELDAERITGGGLSPSPSTSSSVTSDIRGKISVFQRFFRSSRPPREDRLQRDFSIDEKSDTLFREFSRQDPALDSSAVHRPRSTASWRQGHLRMHHPYGLIHHHHPSQQHHAPLPVHHQSRWSDMKEDIELSVLGSNSTFSPQLSIDEESDGIEGLGRHYREALSERSLTLQDIPVIRLPAND